MAEIIRAIDELQQLPADLHWFCPRQDADDHASYLEEDLIGRRDDESEEAKRQRLSKLKEAGSRKTLVFQAIQILAFNGNDAVHYQQYMMDRIAQQMQNCDTCIRIYHRSRTELRHGLEAEFDEEEVASFMEKFDKMNLERITKFLDHATNELLRMEPADRKINKLKLEASYAIFEALSCEPFLGNESLLAEHFDQPFRLVQSIRRLKLTFYVPAATAFLFSADEFRRQWAEKTWNGMARMPTRDEFAFAIRDPLFAAMARVQMTTMDREFLPAFWKGMTTIVPHLDKDLVTHSLRGIDIDICMLSLEHMHLESQGFPDLITTLTYILITAPEAYWDSMQTISPSTIIEQIFQSRSMDPILQDAQPENTKDLEAVFTWIGPFLASIPAAHQPGACRSLVDHLVERRRSTQYPLATREYCFDLALAAMNQTIGILNRDTSSLDPACAAEMLDVVNTYSSQILIKCKGLKNTEAAEKSVPLQVIERAIELESLVLISGGASIARGKPVAHNQFAVSGNLWPTVLKNIRVGDLALATHALVGSRRLVMLEKFISKASSVLPKDAEDFNSALDKASGNVTEVLERVNDFSTQDISGIFKTSKTATGLIAMLLFSDESTRRSAIGVLKTLSSEDGRREALSSTINSSYTTSVTALAQIVQQVLSRKVFTPMSAAIRICTDVVDALCNTQDGILRARDLTDDEAEATRSLWRSLWQALAVIFDNTERWSHLGHDKTLMMDFCRDVMQFADELFVNHSVLVSALTDVSASHEDQKQITTQLLKYPNVTMTSMVKWLRLRDDYLASKIVKLVTGLLGRLHDASIEITDEACSFLEDVFKGTVKVRLTGPQLAALSQALSTHLGIHTSVEETTLEKPSRDVKLGKQTSISSWITDASGSAVKTKTREIIDLNQWRSAADKSRPSPLGSDSDSVSEGTRKLIMDSTRGAEAFKARMMGRVTSTVKKPPPKPVKNDDFMRQRAAENEALRARKAAALAKARMLRGELGDAGSGLKGLKVTGKDHSAKGTGMMVSSSEEEESEDDDQDDLDRELFPKIKSANGSRAGIPDIQLKPLPEARKGPLKLKRQVRSAKDMRARLAPDLSSLHKTILGWEYFHPSDYPPGADIRIYDVVPAKFRTPVDYRGIFEPLLILEAWQGFVKAREENNFKAYEVKVLTRSSVDSFVEVSSAIPQTEARESPVSEGDVVLLSMANSPASSPDEAHCLARVRKLSRKKGMLEILYHFLPTNDSRWIMPDKTLWAIKIQSLTPLEREYGALQGLQYYDLCDYILNAQPSNLLDYGDKLLDPIMDNYSVNRAQAKAVKSAIDNDAFTLIQGPPGSGKTKTIVAIVGALLTDSLRDRGMAISRPNLPGMKIQPAPAPKKILVCAPSNAAVDELVMRFKDGIRTMSGQDRQINIVRLGRTDAINTNVSDVTLDELVNARLNSNSGKNEKQRLMVQTIMAEHKEVSAKLREVREKLNKDETKQVKEEFETLRRRKAQLSDQIDRGRDKEKQMSRQAEVERKIAQQAILDQAHIICATLSGSGHEMFQNLNIEFETVVVDEAAQCVEASALIPLKYGCARCILVGDPKQLPPTVFSKEASRFRYEQSLFVRMQTNHPKDVHLLDTQYRMHPEISVFPSDTFYDGRLLDGPGMAKIRTRPWHAAPMLGPYRFFDVQGQHQAAPRGHSLINLAEIDVALHLYERLTTDFGSFDFKAKIGIITPYKSQLAELKSRFIRHYGQTILDLVEFNTTDAFQGRESEVIIFSCVRASPSGNIGFLQDIRRMNVGLTRAKSSLWVLGNSHSLMRGEFWAKLIEDAKKRDRFSQGNYVQLLKKPSPTASTRTTNASAHGAKPSIVSIPSARHGDIVATSAADDISMSDASDSSMIQKQERKPTRGGPDHAKRPYDNAAAGWNERKAKTEQITYNDVEMEDAPPLKNESTPAIKPETKSRSPIPTVAGMTSGSRPPPVIKRVKRKEAANPLVAPNRPKKPKTG